ncbi:hypothetical protein, partial [Nocardia farcinica]|uniref:hypothetical protein n=1 Tax=Nocardia farcinica TaxID=37329 RepID=UPI002454484F
MSTVVGAYGARSGSLPVRQSRSACRFRARQPCWRWLSLQYRRGRPTVLGGNARPHHKQAPCGLLVAVEVGQQPF